MTHTVFFSRQAEKSIDRLGKEEKRRLKERIDEIAGDPSKAGAPLHGPFRARGIWRARVGDLRILYKTFTEE